MGFWGSVIGFPEFGCASLRAIFLRASGAFRNARQIPERPTVLRKAETGRKRQRKRKRKSDGGRAVST